MPYIANCSLGRTVRLIAILCCGTSSGCVNGPDVRPVAAVPAPSAAVLLWGTIALGAAPDSLGNLVFDDARHIPRRLSRHFDIGTYYLQDNDPVTVHIVFAGRPKRVSGVDLIGTREDAERAALLRQFGPPQSKRSEDVWASPGGSAMLNDGGKRYRIWTWQKNSVVVTFEERVRPGYFVVRYRPAAARQG